MKKIIDILGIVLLDFIVIYIIIRLFKNKVKNVKGYIIFFGVLVGAVLLTRYVFFPRGGRRHETGAKTAPLSVSRHSETFNGKLENVLDAYFSLTATFSGGDTASINRSAKNLQKGLDSLQLEELKTDSLIYQTALQPYNNAKSEIVSIITDPSIKEKKGSLNIFSSELMTLLSTVRYDRAKLYWQECENAFGEDRPGNWLSRTEKSVNPYGQPDCADIKSVLNFLPADTTKKQ
ncbi:MAG: DUF3347 domain-containing protein [Chitinophagaceae bacterium]|nr:DUF3347 domain-containing protein [Chitinophagaceae bacterium]